MYKILLADDEGIELDALRFILEKTLPGNAALKPQRPAAMQLSLPSSSVRTLR